MKKLIALLLCLSPSAFAATTISTTLTMTSPSAYISMTGVSSTAYLKNLRVSNSLAVNTSTTLLGVGTVDANKTIPCAAFVYDAIAQTTKASSSLITAINLRATGTVDVSGSFPSTPWPICTNSQSGGNDTQVDMSSGISPSTAGFVIRSYNLAGVATNTSAIICHVYCQ